MYNVHSYFSLKLWVKKVRIMHSKIWYLLDNVYSCRQLLTMYSSTISKRDWTWLMTVKHI